MASSSSVLRGSHRMEDCPEFDCFFDSRTIDGRLEPLPSVFTAPLIRIPASVERVPPSIIGRDNLRRVSTQVGATRVSISVRGEEVVVVILLGLWRLNHAESPARAPGWPPEENARWRTLQHLIAGRCSNGHAAYPATRPLTEVRRCRSTGRVDPGLLGRRNIAPLDRLVAAATGEARNNCQTHQQLAVRPRPPRRYR